MLAKASRKTITARCGAGFQPATAALWRRLPACNGLDGCATSNQGQTITLDPGHLPS